MRIEVVRVKNFRPIDPIGIEVYLKQGLNVLVGENNAGKSAIATAIAYACEALKAEVNIQASDYYKGNTAVPIEVSVIVVFSQRERERILDSMLGPAEEVRGLLGDDYERIRQELGSSLCEHVEVGFITRQRPHREFSQVLKFGDLLYVRSNMGKNVNEFGGAHWDVRHALEQYSKSDATTLRDFIESRYRREPNTLLRLYGDVQSEVSLLLQDSVRALFEVRLRPAGGTAEVLESPDGRETADVLQKLKNSDDPDEVNRWETIASTFHKVFPSLRLDSVRVGGKSGIRVIRDGFRVPEDGVAMGTIEVIIMLTNIIRPGEHIITIEEPELHLHPHAQRAMANFIRQHAEQNQVLLVTHSNEFIYPARITAHILVRQEGGRTRLSHIPADYFTSQEQAKLELELRLFGAKEIFFSRSVILVEGPCEAGALPGFGDKLNRRLDEHGVSVVHVASKDNFWLFVKLCEKLGLPYFVLCDQDALLEAQRTIEADGQPILTSSVFYQLDRMGRLASDDKRVLAGLALQIEEVGERRCYSEVSLGQLRGIAQKYRWIVLPGTFEQVLHEAGCSDLLEAAKNEVGTSKALQGLYVGRNIDADHIPQVFRDIIEESCQGA